ncbi:TIGR00730 family Rossman fold protein [Nannocystis sp.]|uniref:LOG family protein n=1 Tax=Nannocystis sp. TaxID=1962667 RepID=UPI0024284CF2|nr:TIGR00730 family Rossman fold protein [Nannocystis sp.]MBK7828500.1 TIGR00730 family Rossman fold protein [Nannocystis sp.]MBK9758049.1 TIGR00730 family Rossman fold protein [Nannocystis sp.]
MTPAPPRVFHRICVFCGSAHGNDPIYTAAARALGRELAERGIEIVYGGGRVGLMGELADAALAAGGRVLGVIPQRLRDLEVAHSGLHELFVVDTMHARKAMMAHLSDAFIALPGGFGTLEELFEVVTWCQIGYHQKPVGILDVAGYYAPLLRFLDHAEASGFIRDIYRPILQHADDLEALLAQLAAVALPRFVAPPPPV